MARDMNPLSLVGIVLNSALHQTDFLESLT